jgi:MFS family permease
MTGSMTVTAAAPTVPAALAGLAGVGLAWSLVITSVLAVLQRAEPAMLGRVMSLFALVLLGSAAAGGPIASSVATSIGPRAPFVLGAGAAAAAILITAFNRPFMPRNAASSLDLS